jgi:hypothetical protein
MPENGGAGLVPEVYYDVIARLCAGAPFVAYAIWHSEWHEDLESVKVLVVATLGSYLLGHLLGTISAVANLVIWRPRFLKFIVKRIPLDHPLSSDSFRGDFHELYKRIDSVARRDPNGGTVLKKMEAGAALSDNLLSGFLLFVTVRLIVGARPTCCEIIGGAVFTLLLFVTVIVRRMVLIGRQDTLWSASHEEGATKTVAS